MCRYDKKTMMDKRNGLFRELTKISFFKNEEKKIENCSYEFEITIVFLQNKRIFQKILTKSIFLTYSLMFFPNK